MSNSESRGSFLDVFIKKQGRKINTDIYKSPTDTIFFSYLGIVYPYHLNGNLPYSQKLQVRMNSTLDSDFYSQANILMEQLKDSECSSKKGEKGNLSLIIL